MGSAIVSMYPSICSDWRKAISQLSTSGHGVGDEDQLGTRCPCFSTHGQGDCFLLATSGGTKTAQPFLTQPRLPPLVRGNSEERTISTPHRLACRVAAGFHGGARTHDRPAAKPRRWALSLSM